LKNKLDLKFNNYFRFIAAVFTFCSLSAQANLPQYTLAEKQTISQITPENELLQIKTYLSADLQKVSNPKHATHVYLHNLKEAKSILIMHGLFESPNYMRSLAKAFFDAGYNVISLRLDGHFEKTKFADTNVKAENWLTTAENGLHMAGLVGEQVEILGYSTGGTLGVYLSLKHPQVVKKLYLISPALKLSLPVQSTVKTVGRTDFTTWSKCDDKKTIMCKMIQFPDQLSSKVNEGLEMAPAMGLEVARLIDLVVNQFAGEVISFPGDQSGNNKLAQMRTAYMKMQVPLYMVNTDLDNIVDKTFNKQFAIEYPFLVKSLSFAKRQGVYHGNINKNYLDRIGNTKKYSFNPYFQKIIELFDL